MVRLLNRLLISLNLGFAIALSITLLASQRAVGFVHGTPAEPPGIFQRLVIFANRAIHHVPWSSEGTGIALLSLTIILFLILLPISKAIAKPIAFLAVSGVIAVSAVPIAWLVVALVQGSVAISYAVLFELVLLGGILYLTREHITPVWFVAVGVHYFVWTWFVWNFAQQQHAVFFEWRLPMLVSLAAPCSGYVWLKYLCKMRQTVPQHRLLA